MSAHATTQRNSEPLKPPVYEVKKGFGPDQEFPERAAMIQAWQEYLRTLGVPFNVDYTQPLKINVTIEKDEPESEKEKKRQRLRAHFHNSSVFLSQFMTDLLEQAANKKTPATVYCNYQGILVHFEKEHDKEKFYLTGLRGDLKDARSKTDETYVNNLLLENIKGALLLVQNAKLSGWSSITFGDTKDPCKRLALKLACETLGVDCSKETIDIDTANKSTIYGDQITSLMETVLGNYENAPNIPPSFEVVRTNSNIVTTEISDDDLLEDTSSPIPSPKPPTIN